MTGVTLPASSNPQASQDKETAISFVPPDFEIPELLETDRFRIRPLTIHDVVRDYDAVMTSREQLWEQFGQAWGWPSEDLTLEQDLIDLASHQKEAQRRSSFTYAVLRPDERVQLGCLYIVPSHKDGFDAAAALWVRASEAAGDLDRVLYDTVRRWLAESPAKRAQDSSRVVMAVRELTAGTATGLARGWRRRRRRWSGGPPW